MQTIRSIFLISVFIVSIASVEAHTALAAEDNPTLKEEITKLLQNPDFSVSKDTTVKVHLMVNNNNELVILSVDTEKEPIEYFIKGRLNYRKMKNVLKKGELYILPVTITSE
ncbi:hypothetical protein POV27_16715 [Aureisphaera galaxeae]|uniref:hypothetical protein n=1 Tax=Aureisphaera galaxeae TaxID=1538023 RepID=UPI0023508B04|nr:hypothetical protein [Aureisphaera galaxeae]MDC8005703.1 hypothetical protein [Aureisphaera galaxeae]